MSYKAPQSLVYQQEVLSRRNTGFGTALTLSFLATFLLGGSPIPAQAQNSPRTHMQHVQTLEKLSDDKRAQYLIDTLNRRGIHHEVHPYEEKGFFSSTKGRNITWDIGEGKRTLYFTAHYDTKGGPGANDDVSCVAVMLNLYERVAKENLKNVKVRFAVFGNEEDNRVGSKQYVENRNLDDVDGVLSLEMCGSGRKKTIGEYTLVAWDVVGKAKDSEMFRHLRTAASKEGLSFTEYGAVYLGGDERNYSDHVSFREKGIPGFALIIRPTTGYEDTFERYHTPFDTADALTPAAMGWVSDAVLGVIKEFEKAKAPKSKKAAKLDQ